MDFSQGYMAQQPHYTPDELHYFEYLIQLVDPQGTNNIGGKETVAFFKSSGLEVDQLRDQRLWEMSAKQGYLDQQQFYIALKLIALVQAGYEMAYENLNIETPLPRFQGISQPPQPQRNIQPQYSSVPPSPSQHMSIQRSQYDMTQEQWQNYDRYFQTVVQNNGSFISGTLAKQLFVKTQLHRDQLSQIWTMCDIEAKGYLLKGEFIVAIHLIGLLKKGTPLPSELPDNLISVARGEPVQQQVFQQRMGSSQQIIVQPRLGSNQSIQVSQSIQAPRRLSSNSNMQPMQPIQVPMQQISPQQMPQRLGSNSSIQFQNNLSTLSTQQSTIIPVNPSDIPGWDPLQQQMNLARQQLGTVQSSANNTQMQLKELFDRILIEKQQEISTLQQMTNSYRMLLQHLQEQHNSFQVELSKLETARTQQHHELSQVQQQVMNQHQQNTQLQAQYIQQQQQYQQQPPTNSYPSGPTSTPNSMMRNSWDDIKDPLAYPINNGNQQMEPPISNFQTYYPPSNNQGSAAFYQEQALEQPKGVLKQQNNVLETPQMGGKKQVHFSEPSGSKNDVTLGQIEVDLNKEFKGDDWAHEESSNAWSSWNAPQPNVQPAQFVQPAQQTLPWN